MKTCIACRHELPDDAKYCTRCGRALLLFADAPVASPKTAPEEMNMQVLYVMVVCLALALLVPPWETPPRQAPEFLGFHFFWEPPEPDAIVSRLLMTIELTTIGVAGLYFSWLFRKRKNDPQAP